MQYPYLTIWIIGLCCLASISPLKAQQLPNAAFELWNGPTIPLEWTTANDLFPGVITSFRSDDSYAGDFAIGLRTAPAGFADLPGLAGLVEINPATRSFSPGLAFSGRPDSITGFYTYVSGGCRNFDGIVVCPDACRVILQLSRWTGTEREIIGAADWSVADTVLTYQRFTAPVVYSSMATPDSILLLLSSSSAVSDSAFYAVRGSMAKFDELALVYNTVSIEESSPHRTTWHAYPSPSTHSVYIDADEHLDGTMQVYDLQGRLQTSLPLDHTSTINCEDWAPGWYILSYNGRQQSILVQR